MQQGALLSPTPVLAEPESTVISAKDRISLGSVEIDVMGRQEFLDHIVQHALHGRRTNHIVTVNAQLYTLASTQTEYRENLSRADTLCADGMPIVWACKAFANQSVPRLAGVDLVNEVCAAGAAHGLRVMLLGGRPGMAEHTGIVLSRSFPGINIVATHCPPFGFEKNKEQLQEALAAIQAAQPHVLFVALGAPKQEFFIDQHVRALQVPVAVGIGGSFEILSGQQRRAPLWMQRTGLEWSFRLLQEPKRLWRRYLIGNAEFLLCICKWRLRERRAPELVSVAGAS